MRVALLFVLGVGLVAAGDNTPGEAARKEMKKLEGTWTVEKAAMDGKSVKDKFKEVVIAADRFIVKGIGGKEEVAKYRVDPSKKPKTMDFTVPEEVQKKAVRPGQAIYELTGDTLRLCVGPPGRRPREFSDQKQILLLLKRKKS
jgi:uncharacterized protein (TIGR03067 family)